MVSISKLNKSYTEHFIELEHVLSEPRYHNDDFVKKLNAKFHFRAY